MNSFFHNRIFPFHLSSFFKAVVVAHRRYYLAITNLLDYTVLVLAHPNKRAMN